MTFTPRFRLVGISILTVVTGLFFLSSDLQRQRLARYVSEKIGRTELSPLAGIHTGTLLDFWGSSADLSFMTTELSENQILFTLGLPGSTPQVINAEALSQSRPIVLASNGLRIILSLNAVGRPTDNASEADDANSLGGTYKELGSGIEGRWLIER